MKSNDKLTPSILSGNELAFIMSGNAVVTLQSLKTGKRYTYRINQPKENADSRWFVSLLTGPDNTEDYKYLGMIRGQVFRLTAKSAVPKEALPIVAFDWVFRRLVAGKSLDGVEVWHAGRCGRCGRPLTVPESIASGYGPECINKAVA